LRGSSTILRLLGYSYRPVDGVRSASSPIRLKALYIRRLGIYLRTHSVTRLVEEVSRVIELPGGLAEGIRRLDRYYIPTKYPTP
jgi:HEPN domain-containing protein